MTKQFYRSAGIVAACLSLAGGIAIAQSGSTTTTPPSSQGTDTTTSSPPAAGNTMPGSGNTSANTDGSRMGTTSDSAPSSTSPSSASGSSMDGGTNADGGRAPRADRN